jgi:hypothetical protein
MKKTKIILSITGGTAEDCLNKINEADKMKLSEIALFLERIDARGRRQVYARLKNSGITSIPLVHLRRDMTRAEVKMLADNYRVKYFTIHEDHFKVIKKWRGFYRQLYLEMSTDDYVARNVKVEKIGGFCVDLAHYKKQQVLDNKDFKYVHDRENKPQLFACNHLSGYDPKINTDLHRVKANKDFVYLKKLPPVIFGRLIAMEIDNYLAEQNVFRKYVERFL